nr:FISUMP domain-containing protein [uncultured Flavobacterium sp.]
MKNLKVTVIAFLSIVTIAVAQAKKSTVKVPVKTTTTKSGAITTTYPSVIIGDQEWMSKNLDVSTFRNGDPIPQAKTNDEWKSAYENKKPAWRYYLVGYSKQKIFGIPEKTKKYGKLYNWYAFNNSKILAPKGWHNPSIQEWNKLFTNYSYEYNSYYKDYEIDYTSPQLVEALKSETGWAEFYGNNSSGFNVLPAGYRYGNEDKSIGEEANFWAYAEEIYGNGQKSGNILLKSISFGSNSINIQDGDFIYGYSVRLVKDIDVAPVVQEKKGPTAQNYCDNGLSKINSKDFKGAIEDYSNAIQLSPNCDFCYQYRGFAEGELKDYNKAILDYKKAIGLSDGNLDFISSCQLNMGITYIIIGKKNEGCVFLNESLSNGNKQAQNYINQYCEESVKQSEPIVQINSVKLRSAKQVLPLLMNDLSNMPSYKIGITKLGYHTTGNNNEGGAIYTSDENDWIIYNNPVNKNEISTYSLVYYSKEVDNIDSVLSYLDEYDNPELYDGYALEPESSHEMKSYFSNHKSDVLLDLNSGINKSLDSSKYYIKERLDKNTLIRGIRLVNKSENGIEKPYYTAFIFIQQEGL